MATTSPPPLTLMIVLSAKTPQGAIGATCKEANVSMKVYIYWLQRISKGGKNISSAASIIQVFRQRENR